MQNLEQVVHHVVLAGGWQNLNLWHPPGAQQNQDTVTANQPNDHPSISEQLKLERRKELSCPYKRFIEKGDLEDDSLFIDTAAVEEMTQVVGGLKENGGFLGNLTEWLNSSIPGSPASLNDGLKENTANVRLAKAKLIDFKHISEQFQKLSKCLEVTCAVAERRLCATQLRIGFASLPNELLTNILSLAIPSEEPDPTESRVSDGVSFRKSFWSAVTFSHVCDRFRRVALSSPKLWNKISDDMSQEEVKACLLRSGRIPLDICLASFPDVNKYPNFYLTGYFADFVLKSFDRWKRLEITTSPYRKRHLFTRRVGIKIGHLSKLEHSSSSLDGHFSVHTHAFPTSRKP
ncbi:hypothetical protein SCHPADRAFT_97615 [Schizopora paradoxa]|uniref:Uncharacterized protein n=1 Tax=Schizopora paradoxa TaxID=27342 RepID=A0A0H2S4Z4_9AGAM|nr:hypothetical protein SCHPADRAFT_97615 [Schizopora paradoxa]